MADSTAIATHAHPTRPTPRPASARLGSGSALSTASAVATGGRQAERPRDARPAATVSAAPVTVNVVADDEALLDDVLAALTTSLGDGRAAVMRGEETSGDRSGGGPAVRVTRDASQREALESRQAGFAEHFIWPIERDDCLRWLLATLAGPDCAGGARESEREATASVAPSSSDDAASVSPARLAGSPAGGAAVAGVEPGRAAPRIARGAAASDPEWIAHSPAMRRVDALLRLIARASRGVPSDVLLHGPSGAGKEAAARRLHRLWRPDSPFVAVNCAALPETMLEALLFGHVKGAFTGAIEARRGKFEQASGGVLLLDEVTEMPLGLQAKLLRVLQERVVEPLGSARSVGIDVRVVATTNRELREALHDGRLRPDLYYRLAVFPVALPALRDRLDDVWPLAQRFARAAGTTLAPDARLRLALEAHPWPGNVRELANVIARAALLAQGAPITADHLWFDPLVDGVSCRHDVGDVGRGDGRDDAVGAGDVRSGAGPIAAAARHDAASSRASSFSTVADPAQVRGADVEPRRANALDLGRRMLRAEYETVLRALDAHGGRREPAARALGVSPRTLRHKLARYRDAGWPVPSRF